MINPYKILKVHRESSPEQIKESYYKLMKKNHPDAGGEQSDAADITLAYSILNDKINLRNHLAELEMLGVKCQACKGRGFMAKQKSMSERITTPCVKCGGQGLTMKEKK